MGSAFDILVVGIENRRTSAGPAITQQIARPKWLPSPLCSANRNSDLGLIASSDLLDKPPHSVDAGGLRAPYVDLT
jgi:hypothetical protein